MEFVLAQTMSGKTWNKRTIGRAEEVKGGELKRSMGRGRGMEDEKEEKAVII